MSTTGFCAGCGKKFGEGDQYLQVMNAKWHKACFRCSECSNPITGAYADLNDQVVCADCVQKKQKSGSQTSQTVGPRVGFTIDPKTGQKKYTVGNAQQEKELRDLAKRN